MVQVASQKNEADAKASYRGPVFNNKFRPRWLRPARHQDAPISAATRGVSIYRTMVGPFVSTERGGPVLRQLKVQAAVRRQKNNDGKID